MVTLTMDSAVLDDIIGRLLDARNGQRVRQVFLTESEIQRLCLHAKEIFLSQPCLLELEAPLKICGDIHGQYLDLLFLFEFGGLPPLTNYLFLGNYVDYGKQCVETICLLLAYKVKYPENFFLLRGKHECASINRIYGFYDECKRRFNVRLWKMFIDCFNCLPIAAVVDEKIFCVHGGLSPDLKSIDQIRTIIRPTDVPDTGLLCDLLWADPTSDIEGWGMNERGLSYVFGPAKVSEFLQINDLDIICRGAQIVEDGYEFFADRQLVTIFSAPNHRGEFDNAGAIMAVEESLLCTFQILKPAEKKLSLFKKMSIPDSLPKEDVLGSRIEPEQTDPRPRTPPRDARDSTTELDNSEASTSAEDAILCTFQIQLQIRNPYKKKWKAGFGNCSQKPGPPFRKEQKQ